MATSYILRDTAMYVSMKWNSVLLQEVSYLYHQDDINNMNYKQLRETVSELNDKYVKLKRTLEDALDNIDESNLATNLRKK